jgi:two-component system, OmpR family, KDP operon response regulator KdpE
MSMIGDNCENPIRIGIIEDDPGIRRFLRAALEEEGWCVEEAGSGSGGKCLVAERPPDLLLVDLGLPDMEGTLLIREIRSRTAAPIIVLSARNRENDKILALDSGADDYLTKPIGASELRARLRAHLRRRNQMVRQVAFGDVRVDLDSRQVFRGEALVHLSPTEFGILEILCRKAGKVVTQRELLNEVWGAEHKESAHYLRIYMGHLRHKLELEPARPRHLQTELGVGYRLILEV